MKLPLLLSHNYLGHIMRIRLILFCFLTLPAFGESVRLQSMTTTQLNLHNRMNASVILPPGHTTPLGTPIGPIPIQTPLNIHHRPINQFTHLDVHGNVNLTIRTGRHKPKLILDGDPNLLKCTTAYVAENTLYIAGCIEDESTPPIQAIIETRHLDGLSYRGNGNIRAESIHANMDSLILDTPGKTKLSGKVRVMNLELKRGYLEVKGLSSPRLTVSLFNNARAKLTGIVSLRKLKLAGNNWFSLSWADSPRLTIESRGNSYFQIAGIVNWLDAELWDHSRFNAKFLRVHRSFVKTHDNAIAEITTTAHQHTLATDASDILFYKLPKNQTNFMAFDGAVLDMRHLEDPNIEEPERY